MSANSGQIVTPYQRLRTKPASHSFVWCPGFWRPTALEVLLVDSAVRSQDLRSLEQVVGHIYTDEFFAAHRVERLATPAMAFIETTHRGKVDARILDAMRARGFNVSAAFLPPLRLSPRGNPAYSRLNALKLARRGDDDAARGTAAMPPLRLELSLGMN